MAEKSDIEIGRAQTLGLAFALALLLGGLFGIFLRPAIGLGLWATVEAILPLRVFVAGIVVVFVGLGLLRFSDRNTEQTHQLVSTHLPPEEPKQPPAQTGAEVEETIANAAIDVSVKQVEENSTDPHTQLTKLLKRVITSSDAIDEDAITVIETGEWTDDTIARAFLSETQDYPLRFRLVRWARPAMAYDRAVTRTVQAIAALADSSVPGYRLPEKAVNAGQPMMESGNGSGGQTGTSTKAVEWDIHQKTTGGTETESGDATGSRITRLGDGGHGSDPRDV